MTVGAQVSIPIDPTLPFITQTTALDGVSYQLTFRYNQRQLRYFMDIALADGTLLAAGAALVVGWPLFRNVIDPRMPQGAFIVVAQGADVTTPPAFGELGIGLRCELIYTSRATP
jgi:hypothetical protein